MPREISMGIGASLIMFSLTIVSDPSFLVLMDCRFSIVSNETE